MRKQISTLLVGAKGCGKTTVLMDIVKAQPESVRVCFVYNGTGEAKIEAFKQVSVEDIYTTSLTRFRINYTTKNNLLERLEKITKASGRKPSRLMLIFDDGLYFLRSKNFALENILRTQRQRNIDLLFVAHGVGEVPAMFWGFFNTLILFKTTEVSSRNAYKIPDYILEEIEAVNESAKQNGNYYFKITKI